MTPPRNPFRITRRSMIKVGLAASAAVATTAGWFRETAAVRRGGPFFNPLSLVLMRVYFLSPDCVSAFCPDQTDVRHSCNSCKACRNHARNKRWATEAAVERAHACCRCTIKTAFVPRVIYQAMFGSGQTARTEFDFRSLQP